MSEVEVAEERPIYLGLEDFPFGPEALEGHEQKVQVYCGYEDNTGKSWATLSEAITESGGVDIYRVFGGFKGPELDSESNPVAGQLVPHREDCELVATRFRSPSAEWVLETTALTTAVGRVSLMDNGTVDWLPSVNAEYIPVRRGNRVQKTLSSTGRKFKEIVEEQLRDYSELGSWVDWVKGSKKIKYPWHLHLDIVVFYNNQHNRRDCTNMVKLSEDSFSNLTGINDSRHKCVTVTEHLSPDEYEHIMFRAKLLRLDHKK